MKIVTIKEISKLLKVKESTLYSWVHSGKIPSFKINGLIRFDIEEIEAWVKGSRKVAVETKRRSGKLLYKHSIDRIVKKSIESVKGANYNPPTGKNQT